MIAVRREPVFLIHCDQRGRELSAPAGRDGFEEQFDRAVSYSAWAQRDGRRAWLLVPEALRRRCAKTASEHQNRLIAYRDEVDLTLPHVGRKEQVWLVNGAQLPIVNAENDSLRPRRDCEVTVFAPSPRVEQSHYTETVSVDETGRVLRFRRHYSDSPLFADRWTGEAAMISTIGANLRAVAVHLIVHGWSLESIGLLSRRFSVGWSELPAASPTLGTSRGAIRLSETTGSLLLTDAPPEGRREDAERDGSGGVVAPPQRPLEAWQFNEQRTGASPEKTKSGWRQSGYDVVKRTVDVTAAAAGLLLASPLLVLVAALVKLTSRGPVFFAHRRQGRGGVEFSCLKFRTMTVGAHEMQDALRAFNEVDGPQFKIDHDPRLTRVGSWLRRSNIDELPQLFNVLLGQMSLVGPRPSPDDENQLCPAWRRARLSVRPGMTGLWQVLRRRTDPDMDFQEWIYYDVEYARHRSLWLDLQILLHTPHAVLSSRRLGRFVARLQRRGICRHAAEMGWTTAST